MSDSMGRGMAAPLPSARGPVVGTGPRATDLWTNVRPPTGRYWVKTQHHGDPGSSQPVLQVRNIRNSDGDLIVEARWSDWNGWATLRDER